VAVLGDVLYVIGGHYEDYTLYKTAERYDPKTDRWSLIADMNVARQSASATALNGNMNVMKQEGIRTKCVAKWKHNVEVMFVRQHANV
jgi:N-acetylneuraminic acid mutarotase